MKGHVVPFCSEKRLKSIPGGHHHFIDRHSHSGITNIRPARNTLENTQTETNCKRIIRFHFSKLSGRFCAQRPVWFFRVFSEELVLKCVEATESPCNPFKPLVCRAFGPPKMAKSNIIY